MKKMKRRTLIRLISYGVALLFTAVGFAVSGYTLAYEYRSELENTYQRALCDLSSNISNMSVSLQKSMYASTPLMMSALASDIWKDAGNAKANLAMLPVTEISLENINTFLAQIGEYSLAVSKRLAQGESLTVDEAKMIADLSSFADGINGGLNELISSISEGTVMLTEVSKKSNGALAGINNSGKGISGGLEDMENNFEDYPTLIYDGPYSDHIISRESELLKAGSEIDAETAKGIAAKAIGTDAGLLRNGGTNEGKIPTYRFDIDSMSVEVSRRGGHLVTVTKGAEEGQNVLSPEDAMIKASAFLDSIGYTNMKSTYYMCEYGVCTINFAYYADDRICYPDLIKVGISLHDGSVSTFDARGYIMNHTQRAASVPTYTSEQAGAKLMDGMLVMSASLAVIPTDGENETLCWEFKCRAQDGTNIIEYFNADTLYEEELLILLENDNGTLTV